MPEGSCVELESELEFEPGLEPELELDGALVG